MSEWVREGKCKVMSWPFRPAKNLWGLLQGVSNNIFGPFWEFKNENFGSKPLKKSPNQKVIKIKYVFIDDSYLEYCLKIAIGHLLLAPEPWTRFFAFCPNLVNFSHSCIIIMHDYIESFCIENYREKQFFLNQLRLNFTYKQIINLGLLLWKVFHSNFFTFLCIIRQSKQ